MNQGAEITDDGVRFVLQSQSARAAWVCLFGDTSDRETGRIRMERTGSHFSAFVPAVGEGMRYGFRADGDHDPGRGLWFDPAKLLMDPYATRIDRAWRHDPRLGAPRSAELDTAGLVPKAVVEKPSPVERRAPRFRHGGLIYEINVRAFSMLHPDIEPKDRGTLAALAHPSVIGHLRRLGVDAVELMPVTAWIDERHLPAHGLANAWGYNPVTFMAVDPRLAPGGIADLARMTSALHDAGIAVILDLVFNHTGESDAQGTTLSFRGIDNQVFYRHAAHDAGLLVNDTGCGNTVACDHPHVRQMIVDSLRHFVSHAGVDGFRFDLATILGRGPAGFHSAAQTLNAISHDAVLADRVLIAEPWDIGPGGYRLGEFGEPWLEWNDRYRDDVRRFWRGDAGVAGLATRIAGSFDIFYGGKTRSVSYLASHDGFTLADLAAYDRKHNEANCEGNRDGHGANFSANHGAEGPTDDAAINAARTGTINAMLATLFATRGTIMLTAGDEFGRTQQGNNNAYAQDNPVVWIDWSRRDHSVEAHVAALSALRRKFPQAFAPEKLIGIADGETIADVEWLGTDGRALSVADWENASLDCFAMVLATGKAATPRIAVLINRRTEPASFALSGFPGPGWPCTAIMVPSRSIAFVVEGE